jgi:hypothetical protein
MSSDVSAVIEPLIKRRIFATEEEAVRELMKEYIQRQITALQREIGRFERKYGMRFERFGAYLHERSVLLETGNLSAPHHHHDEQGNVKLSPLTGDPIIDIEVVLQEVSGFLSRKVNSASSFCS